MGRQEKGWGGKRSVWDVAHLHVIRWSQSITNVDFRAAEERRSVRRLYFVSRQQMIAEDRSRIRAARATASGTSGPSGPSVFPIFNKRKRK